MDCSPYFIISVEMVLKIPERFPTEGKASKLGSTSPGEELVRIDAISVELRPMESCFISCF